MNEQARIDSLAICNAASEGDWYEDGYRMYFRKDDEGLSESW